MQFRAKPRAKQSRSLSAVAVQRPFAAACQRAATQLGQPHQEVSLAADPLCFLARAKEVQGPTVTKEV